MINQWEQKIKTATPSELAEIKREWKEKGNQYKPSEWPVIWAAMAVRRMEHRGIDPNARPF